MPAMCSNTAGTPPINGRTGFDVRVFVVVVVIAVAVTVVVVVVTSLAPVEVSRRVVEGGEGKT